jgi:hypothetical protein
MLLQEIMNFIRSYVVPEGFPDSVTPSYVPYMTWRALKVCSTDLCSVALFTAFEYISLNLAFHFFSISLVEQ